jgi:hypothetical protein
MSVISPLKNEIDDIVEELDYIFTDDDMNLYRKVLCDIVDKLEQYNRPWAYKMQDRVDAAIERIDAQIAMREAERRDAESRPVEDFLKALTGFVGFLLFCSWLNANKTVV